MIVDPKWYIATQPLELLPYWDHAHSRNFRIPTGVCVSADNIKSILVPIPNAKNTKTLVATYDRHADQNLGLPVQSTSVRGALDEIISRTFGVSGDLISYTRLELSKEPVVTARQYDGGTLD